MMMNALAHIFDVPTFAQRSTLIWPIKFDDDGPTLFERTAVLYTTLHCLVDSDAAERSELVALVQFGGEARDDRRASALLVDRIRTAAILSDARGHLVDGKKRTMINDALSDIFDARRSTRRGR
jgi:hypothetical protein